MRRSFWILMTLLTRPMTWLGAGLAGVAVLWLVWLPSILEWRDQNARVDVGVLKAGKAVRSIEQLEEAIATSPRHAVQIDWGAVALEQFDQLVPREANGSRYITSEHHKIINSRLARLALPNNTVAIHTNSWCVSQAVVDKLSTVSSLERLGFHILEDDDDQLDLSPLANLKRLRALDLGFLTSDSVSLTPLLELPKLEALALKSHRMITKERMIEIAKMPALKTLYLPEIANNPRATEALSELRNSRCLQQIRIAIPVDQADELAAMAAITPSIKVGSSLYQPSRTYVFIAAIWASLALSALGIHFVAQFSLPYAQLVPGFRRWHQLVAWSVIGLGVVALTAMVGHFNANWFPVLGIVGLCLISGVAEQVSTQLSFDGRFRVRRLSGLLFAVTLGMVVYLAFSHPMVIEEHLMSRSVALPLVLIGISVALAAKASRGMNRLCRNRIEKGIPLMLSLHDIQRASIELRHRKPSARDEDTDSLATEPFARQARLVDGFGWLAVAAAAVSMITRQPFHGIDWARYVTLLCLSVPVWWLFVVGVKWWQRMPYLSGMLVRPPSKDHQIDELFRGLRADLIRLWPAVIANVLLVSDATIFSPHSPVIRIIVSGVLVLSITLVCYATILWTLTIRSVWGVGLFCCVIYFALSTVVATIAVLASMDKVVTTGGILIASAMNAAVAIAAVILARRYFQRLEWGRFA